MQSSVPTCENWHRFRHASPRGEERTGEEKRVLMLCGIVEQTVKLSLSKWLTYLDKDPYSIQISTTNKRNSRGPRASGEDLTFDILAFDIETAAENSLTRLWTDGPALDYFRRFFRRSPFRARKPQDSSGGLAMQGRTESPPNTSRPLSRLSYPTPSYPSSVPSLSRADKPAGRVPYD